MGRKANTLSWLLTSVVSMVTIGAWLPVAHGADRLEQAAAGESLSPVSTSDEILPAEFTGHVLTAGRSGGILYAPSNPDNPPFRAEVSDLCGGIPVDYFDARYATPDPTLLASYDCVFTWSNYAYPDYMLFAEYLADYVDAGGRVVLGQWAYSGFSGGGGSLPPGRILEPAYCPVTSDAYAYGGSVYAGDGTTCLHDGVTEYSTSYRDNCELREGYLQDGTYDDGYLAVAYRPDLNVVYVAGMCPSYSTGDFARLLANIYSCSRDGDVDDDGDVDLSDLAALLATYDLCVGEPGYNPGADFDASGCVDLADLAILLAVYES